MKRLGEIFKGVFVIISIILILLFIPKIHAEANDSATVITQIEIPNSPPYLKQLIPNQSWAVNVNLLNSFDLDNYFGDDSGLPISYNFTEVPNIFIVIDENNSISFYPDPGFMGVRNVTFYATDNQNATSSSNLVFLFVGEDSEPPRWYSPSRSKATIYQNDFVNFSTTWTDNFDLGGYLFSINEGNGWVNSSWYTFRGLTNISTSRIQVSASGNNYAYWFFCGKDTSENMNCTDIQVFNVSSKTIPAPPAPPAVSPTSGEGSGGGAGLVGGITGYIVEVFRKRKVQNFIIEPEFFKIKLKQGTTETRILKITNIGNTDLFFNLSVLGIENFVLMNNLSFNLSSGEIKKITIDFIAKKDTIPEQYFGKIVVTSSLDSREIKK